MSTRWKTILAGALVAIASFLSGRFLGQPLPEVAKVAIVTGVDMIPGPAPAPTVLAGDVTDTGG